MHRAAAPNQDIAAWKIAAFAAPAAPLLALTLPSVIFLPPHFAEHLGLPLWVVSAIFFGARMLDLFIDPALGGLQDRTVSSFGRRRIWLALTCPLLMALVWVIFLGLGPETNALIAALSILLFYAVFAGMMVAHLGWSGELIPTYHGRTHVLGAVQTASMIGQTAMLVLAGYVVQGLGGSNADAVSSMGWMLLIAFPVTTLGAVLFVPDPERPPQPHLALIPSIKTVLSNATARRVLAPDLLLGVSQGVSGGLFLFFFQYVLGFEREAQTLLAIYFMSGLAGVPIWWFLARRLGKHRALMAALVVSSFTLAGLPLLPHGAFSIAAPVMALAGITQGAGTLLLRSMMADVVDEDEVKSGARRSGLFFGMLLTTSKFGFAAGPLTYAVLGAAGFNPQLGAANSESALGLLTALFVGLPIALNILAALPLRNYPLDEKRQAQLAAAIAARHRSD